MNRISKVRTISGPKGSEQMKAPAPGKSGMRKAGIAPSMAVEAKKMKGGKIC